MPGAKLRRRYKRNKCAGNEVHAHTHTHTHMHTSTHAYVHTKNSVWAVGQENHRRTHMQAQNEYNKMGGPQHTTGCVILLARRYMICCLEMKHARTYKTKYNEVGRHPQNKYNEVGRLNHTRTGLVLLPMFAKLLYRGGSVYKHNTPSNIYSHVCLDCILRWLCL